MGQENDDGVSYLVSLKAPTPGTPAGGAAAANSVEAKPRSATAVAQNFAGAEKRRSPRYKCEGSAEVREEGRENRTWATFTDISMHGCYVEATATYPVGTVLNVKLNARGFLILAVGNVRVTYPGLGMGIAFTRMGDMDRNSLRDLLRAVTGTSITLGGVAAPFSPKVSTTTAAPALADPAAAIRILVEYFQNRQVLGRDEFIRLVRKSQLKQNRGS